jgi:hypothetical protein
MLSAIGIVTLLSGCATNRTVFLDSQSDIVRLGPGVRGPVYVWRNGQWELTGKTTLPEGWYAGPGKAR